MELSYFSRFPPAEIRLPLIKTFRQVFDLWAQKHWISWCIRDVGFLWPGGEGDPAGGRKPLWLQSSIKAGKEHTEGGEIQSLFASPVTLHRQSIPLPESSLGWPESLCGWFLPQSDPVQPGGAVSWG